VLYVAEKSQRFLPRDPAPRALTLQWFLQAASDISGASNAVFTMENRAPDKSPTNQEFLKKRLLDYFAVCDRRLETHEYLAGELSVADLMLYPNFAARKPLLDQAGGYAYLQRWGAALAARPAIARGMKVLG
jgi:GST-like protein